MGAGGVASAHRRVQGPPTRGTTHSLPDAPLGVRSGRFGLLLPVLAGLLASTACHQWPPAVTGITLVAVDREGRPDLTHAARTLLAPPLPVILVRPGSRPERTGFPLNEPRTGRIHVVLARGTQHFALYTTEWSAAERYLLGIFLDGQERPAFAVLTSEGHWERHHEALGLDGRKLVAALPGNSYTRSSFQVSLDRVQLPIRQPRLDLASPWQLRPDQIADLVGVLRLTVHVVK